MSIEKNHLSRTLGKWSAIVPVKICQTIKMVWIHRLLQSIKSLTYSTLSHWVTRFAKSFTTEALSCGMVAIFICFEVEYLPLMACKTKRQSKLNKWYHVHFCHAALNLALENLTLQSNHVNWNNTIVLHFTFQGNLQRYSIEELKIIHMQEL